MIIDSENYPDCDPMEGLRKLGKIIEILIG